MRMQGIGFLVAAVLCGFGLQYFMTHHGPVQLNKETENLEESFAGKIANQLDQDRLQEFNDFVEQARIACQIPGVAIGIVQNGQVILEQGFGVRNLETQEKVTPETLFMLGSVTKPLTTCMMAKLIDEDFFDWDTPVTQLLPSFAVDDEALTQQLTMSDMVSHANGIVVHKNMFTHKSATPESYIAALRYEKPTTKLGQVYQYSNAMVAAGGYIAAHAAYPDLDFNQAYQKAMQKYLFDIVGMKNSLFNLNQTLPENHADAYTGDFNYQVVQVEEDPILYQGILPAGGVWSNICDMNKYLLFELSQGLNAQNERVVSEKNLLQRREPQVKTPHAQYGLGYRIGKNNEIVTISHGGATYGGFASYMFFLPEFNVGCIILTNLNVYFSPGFIKSVPRKLLELLFDAKSESQKLLESSLKEQNDGFQEFIKNIDFNPSQFELDQYVGIYSNPKLGSFEIRSTKTGIEMDASLWKSALLIEKKSDYKIKMIVVEGPFASSSFKPSIVKGEMELVQNNQVFKRIK